MPMSTHWLSPASKGSSMPSPTLVPPASLAPLFTASIAPGPPPVITAKPAAVSFRPTSSPIAYVGSSGLVRAEPKQAIAGPSSASAPKPSMNSAWMRITRHGSVCTQSLGPRESSNRWSVVVPSTWLRRITTGPLYFSCLLWVIGSCFLPEPPGEHPFAVPHLLQWHELLLLVRQHRVARPEVHRGHAQCAEPCHIRPAELRVDRPPDSRDEVPGGRSVQARQGSGRAVGDPHVVPVEEGAEVGLGLGLAAIGREPVVDADRAQVGQDVAGDAAADPHGVEALVVGQPVDERHPGLVRCEPVQHRGGEMDRVDPPPGPCGVGAL